MSQNSDQCSYHSDSDFSDHEDMIAPALPKLTAAAPKPHTLMSFLCSDQQEQARVLSPRKASTFLSFSDSTPAKLAFSDEKPGLFARCGNMHSSAANSSQDLNEAPASAMCMEEKRPEPQLRLIPVSSLQAENMRRSKQQNS